MNFGSGDKLVVDPKVLSAYNKIVFGKERIVLAGSPAGLATGGDLRKQWVRYSNVYRSPAGGTAAQAKFVGRIVAPASGNAVYHDIGNKQPAFVTGYLLEGDTMTMKELSPYSQLKLAVTDLSQPTAYFRFVTLAVTQPRKNVLIDNLL
jgi:hypothetical protein